MIYNKQITYILADWRWTFREEAAHFLECIQAGHPAAKGELLCPIAKLFPSVS